MHVQVHYQNLNHTPWMDQFIETRVHKLDKYLAPSSNVQVNVRLEKRGYVTSLAIHNPHHDYAFVTQGLNLYEALAEAVDKANRSLGEQKNKMKDKIHRKFAAIRSEVVP